MLVCLRVLALGGPLLTLRLLGWAPAPTTPPRENWEKTDEWIDDLPTNERISQSILMTICHQTVIALLVLIIVITNECEKVWLWQVEVSSRSMSFISRVLFLHSNTEGSGDTLQPAAELLLIGSSPETKVPSPSSLFHCLSPGQVTMPTSIGQALLFIPPLLSTSCTAEKSSSLPSTCRE